MDLAMIAAVLLKRRRLRQREQWPAGRLHKYQARALAALPLVVCLVASWPAAAEQYEAEITADTDLDLIELAESGQISWETVESLRDLLEQPVDLNAASREELYELPNLTYEQVDTILAYRAEVGVIYDPADLTAAGAISEKLFDQIAPFVTTSRRATRWGGIKGRVRAGTAFSTSDTMIPPAYLQVRGEGLFGLKAGVLLMSVRRRLGRVAFDPSREALVARAPSFGFQVPNYYLALRRPRFSLVVGSFRVGYGQRLTIDNTNRATPDGFYPDDGVVLSSSLQRLCLVVTGEPGSEGCTEEEQDVYVTPDYGWREGLRGVAAALAPVRLGPAQLSVRGFGSYQRRSARASELFDRALCDPSGGSTCASPLVYELPDEPSSPASRYSTAPLPDVHDEVAGGGNANLASGRARVGLTGYLARDLFRIEGIDLDFKETARRPGGGPFGAIGIDGALGLGPVNLYAEVARSFDATPSGGGYAAVQRTTAGLDRDELSLVLRYADTSFRNPYARGLSTRNLGGRLRYLLRRWRDWSARAGLDVSLPTNPAQTSTASTSGVTAGSSARVDYTGWRLVQPALLLYYRTGNFSLRGCYDSFAEDILGESVPCGATYRAGARARFQPARWLTVSLQYQHSLSEEAATPDRLKQGVLVWADATVSFGDLVRVKARARFTDDDLGDEGGRSVLGYVQAQLRPFGQLISARYEYGIYFDPGEASAQRRPEVRFRLEYTTSF